nr:hypothetical protein HK105_006751 [Polyrhizophydium stewartii]
MSALLLMTLLSALMGQVLPNLLSKQYTQILASALFIVFGLRLLREGWLMSGNEGQEELEEVTQELAGSGQKEKDDDIEKNAAGADKPKDKEKLLSEAESSTTAAAAAGNPGMKPFLVRLWVSLSDRFRSAAGVFFSPVWIQAFVLTFVAEWGDRSQIATVALAGAEDFWWVSLGCILGHAVCSCIAVIGGRMSAKSRLISTCTGSARFKLAARISVKSVTIIGAVMFVLCGVVGLWEFVAENYYDD